VSRSSSRSPLRRAWFRSLRQRVGTGVSSLALVASGLTALQVASVVTAPLAAAADLSAGSVTTLAGSGANSTVAGTGVEGFAGDGGPGRLAQFRQPHSLVFGPDGRLLICDILNGRIRALDLATGLITTWAAGLKGPRALAVDSGGQLYLALREGNAVYRVDAKTQAMTRFAGTGAKGYSGDGASALEARLSGPKGVACGKDGSVYIADTENHAIRQVGVDGVIRTVRGDGVRGDGGHEDDKRLARPHGVAVGPDGTLYIGDSENNRVLVIR